MKKETRKEERIVVSNHEVYIANDGKEFDNRDECMKYEQELKLSEIEPAFEAMKIAELNGLAPITEDTEFPERDFWWFNLTSEDDYQLIERYYDACNIDTEYMTEPDIYPAMVCIMESDDYVEMRYLGSIIMETEWFFKRLGYTVELTKEGA